MTKEIKEMLSMILEIPATRWESAGSSISIKSSKGSVELSLHDNRHMLVRVTTKYGFTCVDEIIDFESTRQLFDAYAMIRRELDYSKMSYNILKSILEEN